MGWTEGVGKRASKNFQGNVVGTGFWRLHGPSQGLANPSAQNTVVPDEPCAHPGSCVSLQRCQLPGFVTEVARS